MVLQNLFNGSRNAWADMRVESLQVDTTSDFAGEVNHSGDTNINGTLTVVRNSLVGGNFDVTGDSVLDGTLDVAGASTMTSTLNLGGLDVTPQTERIEYSPNAGARFTGAYGQARVRFSKIGDIVIVNVGFDNTSNVATQNGPGSIQFDPDTPVSAQYLPAQTHVVPAQYRVDDGTGAFQYFAPGSIGIDLAGNLVFRFTRDDAGTIKTDLVPDGVVFRTEFLTFAYSTRTI